MLRSFHVNVYARPSDFASNFSLRDAFLPVSFEQALDALTRLPRMDVEPDGFFVLAGETDSVRWQIDGHLFDFGDRMHRVELRGECPAEMFDDLLRCFGWPETPLIFELVREGVALEEAAFREWAATITGGASPPTR
jgi:hypothetical protein